MRRNNVVWVDDEAVPGSPSKMKALSGAEAGDSEVMVPLRKERKAKTCFNYFKEFTENTSLHGLKYLGESRRSVAEKIWWGVMLILSVAACGHLIWKIWNKWQQSPVIVSFAESSTPVWQVPFPAITVCSETKARQSIYNFTEMSHRNEDGNLTEEERKDFEAISLLCDYYLLTDGSNTTNPRRTLDLLTSVAPKLDETMWFCKWKTSTKNCRTLFSPILTEEGLCFTFNMLNAEELFRKEEMYSENDYLGDNKHSQGWSLDSGYPNDVPLDTYPLRGTGSGTKAGLTILMSAYNYDLDYICRGPVQGFKISLHTPSEIPRVSQQYFRVPLAQEVIAAIKPNMMTTSEGLRSYDPKRRQCYFPSERRLKFYKIYTQQNCDLECLTNYTLASCGCVSISMPRNNNTEICSAGRVVCIATAQDMLLTREIQAGLARGDSVVGVTRGLDSVAAQCDCLPACTSITYDAETSQVDFNWQKLFIANKINASELTDINFARAVLFFKEAQFITSRRSELYGQTDFLANCGGLLGLFLGFSFLSLVEIIYFLTLRVLCNLQKKITGRSYANTNHAAAVAAAAAAESTARLKPPRVSYDNERSLSLKNEK